MATSKGNNQTKITISLKADERQALKEAAEARGIKIPTLCAEIIRKHIRKRYAVTERETRNKTKE